MLTVGGKSAPIACTLFPRTPGLPACPFMECSGHYKPSPAWAREESWPWSPRSSVKIPTSNSKLQGQPRTIVRGDWHVGPGSSYPHCVTSTKSLNLSDLFLPYLIVVRAYIYFSKCVGPNVLLHNDLNGILSNPLEIGTVSPFSERRDKGSNRSTFIPVRGGVWAETRTPN